MSDERRPTRADDDSAARGERGGGVSRRALFGGGGVVAAGAVVAGIATGWDFNGSDSGSGDTTDTTDTTSQGPEASAGSDYVPPGARTIRLIVNGRSQDVKTTPETMLLYVLRDNLGLHGPKFGCGLAQCGACAVLVDGRETRACVTPVSAIGRRRVTTLEGLAAEYDGPRGDTPQDLHPLQQAWIEEQVPQCGYCQSGMIVQAADLLSRTPNPSDDEIKQGMDPHLCRCGTHFRIMRAIRVASKVMSPEAS
jgi:isoquinoline 1-oxidoreductase alpha subunit